MRTFIVFVLALICVYAEDVAIVHQDFDMDPDGKQFAYLWETSDGSRVEAKGYLAGPEDAPGLNIDGNVKYVDPSGTPVAWSFKSGPQGYVAEGDFVPSTPPSVVRLLEYLATLPPRPANK